MYYITLKPKAMIMIGICFATMYIILSLYQIKENHVKTQEITYDSSIRDVEESEPNYEQTFNAGLLTFVLEDGKYGSCNSCNDYMFNNCKVAYFASMRNFGALLGRSRNICIAGCRAEKISGRTNDLPTCFTNCRNKFGGTKEPNHGKDVAICLSGKEDKSYLEDCSKCRNELNKYNY